MKKRKFLVFILAALMIFVLTACGGGNDTPEPDQGSVSPAPAPEEDVDEADAEPVELNFHYSQAPESLTGKVYDMVVETVSEASNGNVTIKMFPASTLITDEEIFEAVSSGRVDMAHAHTSYLSSSIPEFAALEVPGLFEGGSKEVFLNQSATIGPIVDEILQKYNLKYIGQFPTDTMTFVGNFVVTDPQNDLIGKKVRTTGAWNGMAVEAWGGSPVNIALGDLATALERGTVDIAFTTWIVIDGQKFYEITPHVTMTNLGEVFVPWVMNLDKWNSLSPKQQEWLMMGADAYENIGIDMTLAQKEAFIQTAEEFGVEMHWSTDEDFAYWNEIGVKFVEDELIPSANEDGLRIIEAVKSLGPNG